MRADGVRLRAAALLGVGALAVHELRYLVAYGDATGSTLAAHGHSYLTLATTLAVLLLLVALAGFLARVARGGRRQTPGRTRRLAPAAAGALLAIYSVQELLEGLVAPGHPGGLAGIYGDGGWTAVLFAAALGLVVALLLRGADAVLERIAARRCRALPRPVRSAPVRTARRSPLAKRLGISRNVAGRAPPLSFGRPAA